VHLPAPVSMLPGHGAMLRLVIVAAGSSGQMVGQVSRRPESSDWFITCRLSAVAQWQHRLAA